MKPFRLEDETIINLNRILKFGKFNNGNFGDYNIYYKIYFSYEDYMIITEDDYIRLCEELFKY